MAVSKCLECLDFTNSAGTCASCAGATLPSRATPLQMSTGPKSQTEPFGPQRSRRTVGIQTDPKTDPNWKQLAEHRYEIFLQTKIATQ